MPRAQQSPTPAAGLGRARRPPRTRRRKRPTPPNIQGDHHMSPSAVADGAQFPGAVDDSLPGTATAQFPSMAIGGGDARARRLLPVPEQPLRPTTSEALGRSSARSSTRSGRPVPGRPRGRACVDCQAAAARPSSRAGCQFPSSTHWRTIAKARGASWPRTARSATTGRSMTVSLTRRHVVDGTWSSGIPTASRATQLPLPSSRATLDEDKFPHTAEDAQFPGHANDEEKFPLSTTPSSRASSRIRT